MSLRRELNKLAHEVPEFRHLLVPILRKYAGSNLPPLSDVAALIGIYVKKIEAILPESVPRDDPIRSVQIVLSGMMDGSWRLLADEQLAVRVHRALDTSSPPMPGRENPRAWQAMQNLKKLLPNLQRASWKPEEARGDSIYAEQFVDNFHRAQARIKTL